MPRNKRLSKIGLPKIFKKFRIEVKMLCAEDLYKPCIYGNPIEFVEIL